MIPSDLLTNARIHVELAGTALVVAAAIGIPLGILAAYSRALRGPLLAVVAIGRTLPSLALLMLVVPFLGVGFVPAVVALTVLAIPPIVINVDSGLRAVSRSVVDAATGMGMSPVQTFTRVAWPLAAPYVVAGLRTAATEVIASATLATFIGAGGLGDDITRGRQIGDDRLIYGGALAVAILALAVEILGARIARRIGVA